MYSIGIDIGTTSVSGIIHDITTGEIIKSVTVPNDSFLQTALPWAKLQDPNRLLELSQGVLDELLSLESEVVAIGVTGQMHGVLLIDKEGNAVSNHCLRRIFLQ